RRPAPRRGRTPACGDCSDARLDRQCLGLETPRTDTQSPRRRRRCSFVERDVVTVLDSADPAAYGRQCRHGRRRTVMAQEARDLRPVILVVDDDEGLRESFRLILDDEYNLLEAPDGARALDILRSTHVDLVLLDVRLPGMGGVEVLERLKAI